MSSHAQRPTRKRKDPAICQRVIQPQVGLFSCLDIFSWSLTLHGMTRLTQLTYITQHYQLKKEWFSPGGGAFIMLSPTEQWALHSYYEFTKKLSDAEPLAHRKAISREHPSLPQRAGKAFSKLRLFSDGLPAYIEGRDRAPKPIKGGQTKLTILSEVHPAVDVPLLVSALLDYGRELRTARARTDHDSLPAKSEGNGHGADAKASGDGGE